MNSVAFLLDYIQTGTLALELLPNGRIVPFEGYASEAELDARLEAFHTANPDFDYEADDAPEQEGRAKRKGAIPLDPDASFTAAQTAAKLSITVEQVIAHAKDGSLKGFNAGLSMKRPRYRFDQADIDAFKAARTALEKTPCQSTDKKARRSTRSTSSSNVVGFQDRLEKRRAEKLSK